MARACDRTGCRARKRETGARPWWREGSGLVSRVRGWLIPRAVNQRARVRELGRPAEGLFRGRWVGTPHPLAAAVHSRPGGGWDTGGRRLARGGSCGSSLGLSKLGDGLGGLCCHEFVLVSVLPCSMTSQYEGVVADTPAKWLEAGWIRCRKGWSLWCGRVHRPRRHPGQNRYRPITVAVEATRTLFPSAITAPLAGMATVSTCAGGTPDGVSSCNSTAADADATIVTNTTTATRNGRRYQRTTQTSVRDRSPLISAERGRDATARRSISASSVAISASSNSRRSSNDRTTGSTGVSSDSAVPRDQ